jgi:hypothetical protein
MCEIVGCLQQSLFREQTPQAQSSALLKQVLKTRFAQITFQSKIVNLARRMRFDHLQNPAQDCLGCSFADGDQFSLYGNPTSNLHTQQGFERLQVVGLFYGEAGQ